MGYNSVRGFRGFSLAIWLHGLGQRIVDRTHWESSYVRWEESYSLRNTLPMALPPPSLSPFLIIPLCYEPIKGLVDVLGLTLQNMVVETPPQTHACLTSLPRV